MGRDTTDKANCRTADQSGRPPRLSVREISLLDAAALVAVFVQVTELYRPLGFLCGFDSSKQVNALLACFFALYLLARNTTWTRALSSALTPWMVAIFFAPALIIGLQYIDGITNGDRAVYWLVFSLSFSLSIAVSTVLWFRLGAGLTKPFFTLCIGGAWVGFVVNWKDYAFLREVMVFGNLDAIALSPRAGSRLLGFYPWPNVAAFSLVIYLAILVCDQRFLNSNRFAQAVTTSAALFGVLLTGSRTSLILVALVLLTYLWNLVNLGDSGRGRDTARRAAHALSAPLSILTLLMVTAVAVFQLLASSRVDSVQMIADRVSSFFSLAQDDSMAMRSSMVSVYTARLWESPLIGKGPDFPAQQILMGNLLNVSQNAWLEWSVKFGVPYSLLVASTFIVAYRRFARGAVRDHWMRSQGKLLLTLVAIASWSLVDPFWLRSVVVALGVVLGSGIVARTAAVPATPISAIRQVPMSKQPRRDRLPTRTHRVRRPPRRRGGSRAFR